MAITIPYLRGSRIEAITQAVMRFLRAVSQITLLYCVIVAARKTFYPNLPPHSPEYTLLAFGSVFIGWLLIKAAGWRRK